MYDRQWEVVYSVARSDETVCVAGNMLGKDFVAAFIVLWFFLTRHPCRVVTTSVDHSQLSGVLWGEMRRFVQTAAHPLDAEKGGPLVVNHMQYRKQYNGEIDGLSYVRGRVSRKGEGMLGHHIADVGDGVPRTLFVADEASGIDDATADAAETWANRRLFIGNPWPCSNHFRRAVKEGSTDYRRVIRIRGEDSPNVRLAHGQRRKGEVPTGEILVPGVLPYREYIKRRRIWDPIKQCIGLDAEFWEGAEVLMFPPLALQTSARLADILRFRVRQALAVGVDTGEGRSNTCWTAGDRLGVIEQESMRTPDTSVIARRTKAFIRKHRVEPENVLFDRGGGGKQIADMLRAEGYMVRTVAFGSAPLEDAARGEEKEQSGVYTTRRAQMFGELSELVQGGWAIPSDCTELHEQLAKIPRLLDKEGRLVLLPKTAAKGQPSLTSLIGRSPDEADSAALCAHGIRHPVEASYAGALV